MWYAENNLGLPCPKPISYTPRLEPRASYCYALPSYKTPSLSGLSAKAGPTTAQTRVCSDRASHEEVAGALLGGPWPPVVRGEKWQTEVLLAKYQR